MLIQGTIKSIQPPDYSDNYGNQYQNITIQTIAGPITGRIARKNPYGQTDIGQQGQWDCTQEQSQRGPYNRLKIHRDQGYGQNTNQLPQNRSQSNDNKKDVDWDAISRGKVRHGVVCAYIQSQRQMPNIDDIEWWVNYIMTGNNPDYWQGNEQSEGDSDTQY
jgi:hypothetical protein